MTSPQPPTVSKTVVIATGLVFTAIAICLTGKYMRDLDYGLVSEVTMYTGMTLSFITLAILWIERRQR